MEERERQEEQGTLSQTEILMAEFSLPERVQVQIFATQVQGLSRQQAIDLLVEMHVNMVYQRKTTLKLIKTEWGMLTGMESDT